jgi:hypothetical protein
VSVFSPKEILRVIDDVIDGNQPLLEWDYLIGVRHQDEFTNLWAGKLRHLFDEYHDPGSMQLLNDAGMKKLIQLREYLIDIDR